MFAKPWSGVRKGNFYGLDDLQLKILLTFIHGQHPEQLMPVIQTTLMEFAHTGHSLVGMYNYLVWSFQMGYLLSTIIETIDHDLQEMHTRLFVARTKQYENMEVNSD